MRIPRYPLSLFVFLVLLVFPEPAHAYLDPGTGNVLIYAIISVFTTVLYFAKNAFYRLKGKKSGNSDASKFRNKDDLVLFSEGKIYWGTFKPIVEALLSKEYPFRYLSMDVEDPGLMIEHPCMNSRYIGEGSSAFAKAAAVRAKIMLVTTPNIGTPGYPMPLPKNVDNLAHVLHGVAGVPTYHKHSVDTCDTLFLVGDHDLESIRLLEKKRNLPEKECVSAGLPYLDGLVEKVRPREGRNTPPVVLIAPSWGEKGCLTYCGTDFIRWLADAGYKVIVRPHPYSMRSEPEFMSAVMDTFAETPNVSFDLDIDGSESLSAADLMISDKSGVRFDFAFLYERPVMTIDIPVSNRNSLELSDLEHAREEEMSASLGPVLSVPDIETLGKEGFLREVEAALTLSSEQVARLRDDNIAHFGKSGEFIAGWLIERCGQMEGTLF